MSNKQRILVVSHGHPDFSLGGAEVAAYNLYLGYQQQPEVEQAWFLARVDRGGAPTGKISIRRKNEYLWEQGISDWTILSTEIGRAHAELQSRPHLVCRLLLEKKNYSYACLISS